MFCNYILYQPIDDANSAYKSKTFLQNNKE